MQYQDMNVGDLLKIVADKDAFLNSGDETCWESNAEIWNLCAGGRNLEVVDLPLLNCDDKNSVPHFEVKVVNGDDTWVFEDTESVMFEKV